MTFSILLTIFLVFCHLITSRKFSLDVMQAKFNNRFEVGANFLLFLDGDNIRGKSGFVWSKEDLLRRTVLWSKRLDITDKVALIFDHGPKYTAHLLHDEGLSCVFSGPGRTADDVIASSVKWCQEEGVHSFVITADSGLKSRCKKNMRPSSGCEVISVDSNTFVDMLESIEPDGLEKTEYIGNNSDKIESYLDDMNENFNLDGVDEVKQDINTQVALAKKRKSIQNQLISLNKLIGNNKGRKKVRKLKLRREELMARLDRISFVCHRTTGKITESAPETKFLAFYLKNQNKLHSKRRVEATWERVVLAEQFHSELLLRSSVLTENVVNVDNVAQGRNVCIEREYENISTAARKEERCEEIIEHEQENSVDQDSIFLSHHNRQFSLKPVPWSPMLQNYCIHLNSQRT